MDELPDELKEQLPTPEELSPAFAELEKSFVNDKAILVDRVVISCPDLLIWGKWMQQTERHVGNDLIKGIRVSTVFLGLNHGWSGPPLWFETMIFAPSYMKELSWGGKKHKFMSMSEFYMDRYATWAEAEAGHAKAVAWVKDRLELSGEYQLQLTYPANRKVETEDA